jgi:ABC-2 type transport system permease protein
MLSILRKELNGFLSSLIAYIVMPVFLVGIGLFVWIYPSTNVLDSGFADLRTFFELTPFIYLFLVPAICMRSFAEEKKTGTLELLFTKPVSAFEIIIGKLLASWVIVFITLVPTLFYVFTIYQLGIPKGNLDLPSIFGSYLGVILLGGVFASIGIFASSLTDNQIVAFIIAVFLSFTFYQGIDYLAAIDIWGNATSIILKFGISYNYSALSKGLIDSRNLIYFFSVITIMVLATKLSLNARRW